MTAMTVRRVGTGPPARLSSPLLSQGRSITRFAGNAGRERGAATPKRLDATDQQGDDFLLVAGDDLLFCNIGGSDLGSVSRIKAAR